MRVRGFVLPALSAVILSTPAYRLTAQQASQPVPQVVTVGRGEIDVQPDRARIEFSVETRAATAAAAAADNSRRQRAVLDSLQKLGITQKQLQTANLRVTPEMVYPGQNQAPRVSGYVARNTVRVEVLRLEQTGNLVDAALGAGATSVSGLQFYSSRAAEARREALAKAVTVARLDAEAMANAAGYQLGGILEISANPPSDGPIMYSLAAAPAPRMAAAMAEPTPVNPGELKIVEMVTVRWTVKQ